MKFLIISLLLLISACHVPDKNGRMALFNRKLEVLRDSLHKLESEYKLSESYLATAQLHQVTRSNEEKQQQLMNLNDYQIEIKEKIIHVKRMIDNYNDSLTYIHH